MSIAEPSPTVPVSVPPERTRLPLSTILTFASPTLGVGFMFFLVGLYFLKFATDVLLVSPAIVSTIFGVGRIWDAISDPFAGFLSDRTERRMGRRRPWMLASAVPIAVAFCLVWMVPGSLEGGWATAWMAVAILGFYTAMTVFIVPHTALGAELTSDYHDRTRVFAGRHLVWTFGLFIAVGVMQLIINAEDGRRAAAIMAGTVSVATIALIVFSATRLRERAEFQGRGGANPYSSFRDVFANPHARLLLIVFFIENLGGATIGILTPFVAQYILGTPELTFLFIMAYMVPNFALTPIWMPLSRRYTKKWLWFGSMLTTAFAFGGMFFLTEGAVSLICVLAALGGAGASCGNTVGPSLQADVIDWDEYSTGERKEGAYFAAWNFVFKAANGITIMVSGYVLAFAGFVANAEQTETARFSILFLYSIFPLVCYVIGAALFSRLSLGEAEHAQIRAELAARR